MAPSLEQHFAAFRATREPKALAAIFDAVAAELLLVAVHLVGDRGEAEDLVQVTFVELIERADDYDPTRPLKPWLIGVLANRAKMAIRRRQRAPTQAGGEDAVPGAHSSPVAAAEAQEAAQHIARALSGLPAHYRQVLVLHLVHGLGGVQIAQALERPPATVRTQLKRGLELLREVLPRVLAVPAALLVAEGRGPAAVRSAVLEHAAVGAAAGAGLAVAGVAGVIAMKKVALCILTVLVGVGLWFQLAPPAPTASLAQRSEATSAPAISAPTEVAATVPDAVGERQREPVRELPAPTNFVTVRGRLVAAWDGTPQVAHAIWITATSGAAGQANAPTRLGDVSSRADGTFELAFGFVSGRRHGLEVYGQEFVAVSSALDVRGPGMLDLGDLRVVRGARIGARVVDEAGKPVPDVWFTIEYSAVTLGGLTRGWTGIGTDAHGYLAMRDDARVHPGEVSLAAPSGYEIVSGARFRVPDDADVAAPTIVVRQLDASRAIAGRVVDERGKGIAGVRVLRGFDDRGFTRADGRFQVFRTAEDDASISLSFVGSATKVGVAHVSASWGTTELVVVQRDAQTLELRVLAADTSAPLTGYKVHFAGSADPLFQKFDLAQHWRFGPHADGRVALPGLPTTGRVALIVAPEGGEYEMSPQLNFDLPVPQGPPLVVRLQPRRPVAVRVVTAAGAPVAGSAVQLVQRDAGDAADESMAAWPRDEAWLRLDPHSTRQWPAPFVVDAATTDAAGLARLRCTLPAVGLGILVTGAEHRPFRASAIAFGDAPFAVVVEAGAALRGRLRSGAVLARFSRSPARPDADAVRLVLRRPGQPITPPGAHEDEHPLAADGSFAIAGLGPGRGELALAWRRPLRAGSYRLEVLEPPLASFDLAAGSTIDLGDLDATPLAPATIVGRALHSGAPVVDGLVTLTLHGDVPGATAIETELGGVRTDREGGFALGGLSPGTYTIHVERVGPDGAKLTLRSEDVIVRRGAQLEQAFELR